ncbi:MAG: hypothetical protein RJA59_1020 [Pseudomonadota bacterium]|jgi:hypothetical protein
MTRSIRIALAVVPFALVVACTDAAKAPAEAAMAAAGSAVESLQGEAAKYAPDAVKAVQASYASAKDLVAKQDYKGALAAASDIPAKAKAALAAAKAKKDEIIQAVSDLAGSVQKSINALKERVAALTSAKKLPAGIDKAAVAKANEGVAAVEAGWQKLTEQVKGGDYAAAMAKGKELKAQADDLLKSLGGN